VSIVAPSEDSSRLRLRRALQHAPLFAELDTKSLMAVERELALLVLPGGTPLFRQGEAADAAYLVASGCLGVFRHQEDEVDEPILIAEITPGNIVGEMSLLSESERTRSVAALRDSEVWRLSRTNFDTLTAQHHEVLPTLMRYVAARNAAPLGKRRRQPRTFAILPAGPGVPAARFAVLLAGALGRIGNQVQMLGSDSLDEEPEWFARCEMDSSFVLYRADPTLTPWTELCLRQADCLVVVRAADDELPTACPSRSRRRSRAPSSIAAAAGAAARPTIPSRARRRRQRRSLQPASSVQLGIHADVDRLARLLTGMPSASSWRAAGCAHPYQRRGRCALPACRST
jgi:NTE family protein